ncbi:PRAME family member 12 [Sciurus carolinensis]|uniref:PRAME family member 12 n=1 Tax=Sciurus carolinensis TaxID=30640 RepID=A0AA41MCA5_SCICA|nr:PRAME family member 12-like [Sciurus carolinensis]MBZ3869198.1 PRAME family member 12 [Sciurus carolinensis]
MSTQTVPTLQDLAIQRVLSYEALPIPNLEILNRVLILQLYKEALMGGHVEMVMKMVLSCPLACLPMGYLKKTRNTKALITMLNGLDRLFEELIPLSQWKLQALDFRDENQESPFLASRAPPGACLQEAGCPKNRRKRRQRRGNQRLKVFIDLQMEEAMLSEFVHTLTSWVLGRKFSVRMYCEKLTVRYSVYYKLMNALPLDYVQELVVDSRWRRDQLERLFFYLHKMRNLRVFRFSNMSPSALTCRSLNRWFSHKYSLQLRKMDKLREFCVNDVFFLQGTLHKILLSQTPLEKLSLTHSPLKESDLKHLAVCPSTDQLKHLELCSFSLKEMSPEPLRDLLQKVANTLETLHLEYCKITDSQLNAILPALGHCSQLRTFHFCGNDISLCALKSLLCHTARLTQLTEGEYPAPEELRESLNPREAKSEKLDMVRREVTQLVKDIRPAHDVRIRYSFSEVLFSVPST